LRHPPVKPGGFRLCNGGADAANGARTEQSAIDVLHQVIVAHRLRVFAITTTIDSRRVLPAFDVARECGAALRAIVSYATPKSYRSSSSASIRATATSANDPINVALSAFAARPKIAAEICSGS